MTYILLALLLIFGVVLILVALLLYQVIQQGGRLLLRIESIEQFLSRSAPDPFDVEDYLGTLPAGVPAPPIDLQDLSGTRRSLAEWRGQRVLLVFFDPQCVFSRKLLPYLVALDADPVPGRPIPVVVTTGDVAANRALFDEAGFNHPVLLQASTAVADAYKVDGTPMSYLIAADGTVASEIATGIQAILLLAGDMAS